MRTFSVIIKDKKKIDFFFFSFLSFFSDGVRLHHVLQLTIWHDTTECTLTPGHYYFQEMFYFLYQGNDMFRSGLLITFPSFIENWLGISFQEAMSLGKQQVFFSKKKNDR